MQQEKFNNNSWKNELDALDGLPGELWNKQAAWGKLEQRLQGKRSKRNTFWYWAAACLTLVASTQWIKGTDKTDPVVKQSNNKTNNGQKIIEVENETPHIVPISKEQQNSTVAKKEKSRSANKSTAPTLSQLVPIDSVLANNTLTEEPSTVMPDTVETAVAEAPVRKPLRVVHINEIGKPVEEKTKLAHARRIGSGGLNGNTFTNDYTTDDNILKIKLSPNN